MIKPLVAALGVAAIAAGAYELAVSTPAPVAAKAAPKVDSDVYVLSEPILVDLAGGGYATLTVGLELEGGLETAEAQTNIVRDIVTKDLTNIDRAELLVRERREILKRRVERDIRKHTDIRLDGVLLTDFTLR
jgi:flagellar FliL protein